MREIRFRAWDGEKKRMWSWRELRLTHYCASLYSHNDGSWEVMEYTGLRDKNGREIYEGDIVRGHFTIDKRQWPAYESDVNTETHPRFVVEFRNGGFMLKFLYDPTEYYPHSYVGLDQFSWFSQPLSDGQTHEYMDYQHSSGLRTYQTLTELEVIGNKYEDAEALTQ